MPACGRPLPSAAAFRSAASCSRLGARAMAHMPPTTAAAAAASGGQASYAPPAAYVYSGPGAGTRSVLSTLHSLREALVPAVKVASLDTTELLAGGWQEGCLLLVMPGGADLPYCKHLNGRGNALIREYVEAGGAYLGLCAGAYYACARVEFEPGTRLEVVGDRELAFFPGKAAGSIYQGFCYESEDGAVAAPLRFLCLDPGATITASNQLSRSSGSGTSSGSGSGSGSGSSGGCSGGCTSGAAGQQAGSSTAAAGEAGTAAAAMAGAALSTLSRTEWQQCVDYVNGGPGFVLLDGSPLAPLLDGEQQQQQLEGQQPAEAQNGRASSSSSGQQQQQEGLAGIQLLATYPEHGNTAAALLCSVGTRGGKAVLCGSHPELHPSWLAGLEPSPPSSASVDCSAGAGGSSRRGSAGWQHPAAAAGVASAAAATATAMATSSCSSSRPAFVDSVSNRAAAASAVASGLAPSGHVPRLQAALLQGQQQRWRFWRSLLVAAGLEQWLQA